MIDKTVPMVTRKKPRTTPPLRPRRVDLSQPVIDPTTDPAAYLDGIDVEPLFVALRIGALDGHLEEIATLVNDRLAAIDAVEELVAASRLHVGDRVRLGHNLRPQYLHGQMVTVIAKDGEQWLVRLDEPVGRFTNADLRVHARQLEPVGPPE
ncbi:MAG: hypothetical protein ACRDZT_05660 [Acidimicrobiales bacterium]